MAGIKHFKAWVVFPGSETQIKFVKAKDVVEASDTLKSLHPNVKVSMIVEFDPTGW